jgi:poly-gamma-glutamate synthesis protein (capsule biosynthesis protein)
MDELTWRAPDLRIINLETAVTTSEDHEDKGINYRMHPENIPCIREAGIDCSSLANNHILDWGYPGLIETLETLEKAGVKSAGAGRSLDEAESPAVMDVEGKGRVILFSFGAVTSGIPSYWAAFGNKPGVNLLKDLSGKTVSRIKEKIRGLKQRGDVAVASIHWGGNWGYEVTHEEREFAHNLIGDAGIDVIHGHSSHHVKGIEVYRGKLILYGCGDFLNDYEGIGGYAYYRADLGFMYFVSMASSTGKLVSLQMVPTQVKHFKVNRASKSDAVWLRDTLNREGERFGTRAELGVDNVLALQWENQ